PVPTTGGEVDLAAALPGPLRLPGVLARRQADRRRQQGRPAVRGVGEAVRRPGVGYGHRRGDHRAARPHRLGPRPGVHAGRQGTGARGQGRHRQHLEVAMTRSRFGAVRRVLTRLAWLAAVAVAAAGLIVSLRMPPVPRLILPGSERHSLLGFSPDGRFVAGLDDESITLWDVDTGHVRLRWVGEPGWSDYRRTELFSPDGRRACYRRGGWI